MLNFNIDQFGLKLTIIFLQKLVEVPILCVLGIGCIAAVLLLIGRRLQKLVRPQSPYLSPIVRTAGQALYFAGITVIALVAGLSLVLLAAAYLGQVLDRIWLFLRNPLFSLVGGFALGVVISLPIVIRLIPQWERGDGLDDVEEIVRGFCNWKKFNPLSYISLNKGCFVGRTENGPLFIPWQKLRETHLQIIGTTGSGKGVVMSLIAYQCCLAGEIVCWVDPKGDRYSPRILQDAAAKAGRPFYYINLNQGQPPQFNIFADAEAHEIEDLFVAGFDLRSKGTDGDYHRGKDEDAAIHAAKLAISQCAQSVPELYQACSSVKEITEQENFWRCFRKLAELSSVNTQYGVDLAKAFREQAVIYVTGSCDSERVKMLQRMLLVRIMQVIKKRDRMRQNPPVCVVLDEFKHVLSPAALTALGVVRDFDAHFLLAHQSLGDLQECPGIDSAAAFGAVVDNTAIKIVYRIGDAEFAERLAKGAGQKRTYIDSATKPGEGPQASAGAWREAQTYLINPDLLTHLPVPSDRPNQASVGVIFGVGTAKVFHVGPVNTEGKLPEPEPAPEYLPVAGVVDAEELI